MSSDKRRWTRLLLAALMAVCLSLTVAACGDDDDDGGGGGGGGGETSAQGGTIKLAVLSNCEGAFGAFYEPDIAGAQVPFINRGAKAENPKKPSDGITGAEVAGKQIEFVGYGCSDGTADKAIDDLRRAAATVVGRAGGIGDGTAAPNSRFCVISFQRSGCPMFYFLPTAVAGLLFYMFWMTGFRLRRDRIRFARQHLRTKFQRQRLRQQHPFVRQQRA